MEKIKSIFIIWFIIYASIIIFGITGYIKNVIKLSECDFEHPYKAEVIHIVGLIPPVGAITGWLNIGN